MFLSKDNYIKECLKGHKRHKRQKNCPKFHPDVSVDIESQEITSQLQGKNNNDPKGLSNCDLLRKIGRYLWPEGSGHIEKKVRRKVVGTFICILFAKGIGLAVPIFWKHLIDHLTQSTESSISPKSLNSSYSTTDSLQEPVVYPFFSSTAYFVIAWAVLKFLEPLLDNYKAYLFATVKQRTTRVMGKAFIEKLFSLDHKFHTNRETGSLLKAIDRGQTAISTVLHATCIVFGPALIQVFLTGGLIMYFCGPFYAATIMVTVVIYAIWSFKFTEYRTPFRIAMNKADSEAGNRATDSLLNYETVKFFGNEKYEAEKYDEKLANFEKHALDTDRSLAALNLSQSLILTGCLVLNIWFAANGVINKTLTLGDVVMIAGYFNSIQKPLFYLGSTYRNLVQAKTDFETMWNLMEEKEEMISGSRTLCKKKPPTLLFENVRFGYNDIDVLKNCSFDIKPGERVALVGGSGNGKSTIVKLLYRLYDPREGKVSINGVNLKDLKLESLRGFLGVVPQDCALFNDTVLNNIRYGRLDATDEEVYDAARIADIHNSIVNMADGYETVVGERGVKLSGGEKQRLAIARCILKNPSIFIYDEATSSLDSLTEQRILGSLEVACHGRSLLVIAHRLSTVVNCDKIIVLQGGAVVEQGTHAQLLAKKGEYATMWNLQNSKKNQDDLVLPEIAKPKVLSMPTGGCCGGC